MNFDMYVTLWIYYSQDTKSLCGIIVFKEDNVWENYTIELGLHVSH